MRSTLANFDPLAEMRAMDTFFERMLGGPFISPNVREETVPIAIFEKDGKVTVKASVPGIDPEDIDLTVENQVLTIRGEFKQDEEFKEAKVYRREYSHGTFSRSIRLPENLDYEHVDAEFNNGFVTIKIPSLEKPKSNAIKVPLRRAESSVPRNENHPKEGSMGPSGKATIQ